jgi:hypothetical protein
MERNFTIDLSTVDSLEITRVIEESLHKTVSITNKSSECSWDRHPFNWTPVFVPIVKHCRQIVAHAGNHIIKEDISDFQKSQKFKVNSESHYEVDDPCCSLECAIALIRDNSHKMRYKDSERLLKMMCGMIDIVPANSYKVLTKFQGPLSIEHFRKGFTTNFVLKGYIVQQSSLFEQSLPIPEF